MVAFFHSLNVTKHFLPPILYIHENSINALLMERLWKAS